MSSRLALDPLERRHRREQEPQPDVDEIDPRNGKGDVTGEDDAFVEHTIDELDKGYLLLERRLSRRVSHSRASGSSAKLYGGHGPVSSQRASGAGRVSTTARKSASRSARTRYAPFRNICSSA